MITKIFKFLFVALLSVCTTSCTLNQTKSADAEPITRGVDYSSINNRQRITFSKQLVSLLSSDGVIVTVLDKCNDKFDGDRNVLLTDLLQAEVKTSTTKSSSKIKFGDLFMRGTKSDNVIENLIVNNPRLQIYQHIDHSLSDTTTIKGIVVLNDNFAEKTDKEVLLINMDGTESSIRTDVEPVGNYLVLSNNERMSYMRDFPLPETKPEVGEGGGGSGNDPYDPYYNQYLSHAWGTKVDGTSSDTRQNMKINKAAFISISAKRQVEPWIAGEPEVRLTLLSTSKGLNNVIEPMSVSYYYPKYWLDLGVFKNNVKWNYNSINMPVWYYEKEAYQRKLIFTEEDYDPEVTMSGKTVINPFTNTEISIQFQCLTNKFDDIIAESYIDYDFIYDEYNWGLIKFTLTR